MQKYIKILILFCLVLFTSLNASSLALTQVTLNPSPLPSMGDGALTFKLVESSNTMTPATELGSPNVTIDVLLNKLALRGPITGLTGTLLNDFNVTYNAATKAFVFTQKANIAAFSGTTITIPVTVTQDSSPYDNSLNGFNANLSALASTTRVSGNASAFTYTLIADVTRSEITAITNIVANGTATSTVTVQLKDVNDVNLTTSGGTITLATTSSTAVISNVIDYANGTYTATVTNTVVELSNISGQLNNIPVIDTADIQFIAGGISENTSTLTVNPGSVNADNSNISTITFQAKDAQGNNLTASAGPIYFGFTSGGANATLTNVVNHNDGTYTATVRNPIVETVTIGAQIAGTAYGTGGTAVVDTVNVSFILGGASTLTSTIVANPVTVVADNTTTSFITLQLKDANANNLSGPYPGPGTVVFTTTSTTATIENVTNHGNGMYSATIRDSASGTPTVNAEINGVALSNATNVTFTANTVSAGSNVAVSQTTVIADDTNTSVITVTLVDANGNPVTGVSPTISQTGSSTIIGATPVAGQPGVYTFVTKNNTAENVVYTISAGGTILTNRPAVNFIPGQASTTQTTVVANNITVVADDTGTSTITVTVKDSDGNLVDPTSGPTLSQNGSSTIINATPTRISLGVYTFVVKSQVAEPVTYTADINGASANDTARVTFIPGVVNSAESNVTVSTATVAADGTTFSLVTVTTKDQFGNFVTAKIPTLAQGAGSSTISASSNPSVGVYTFMVRNTTAEVVTYTATAGGVTIAPTVDVTFTSTAVDAGKSTIVATPSTVEANGTVSTITVTLKDTNDNNITGLTPADMNLTHNGTAGHNIVSGPTDQGNGVWTWTVNSTTAETVTYGVIADGVTLNQSTQVVYSATVIDAGQSTVVATPATAVANGTDISVVRVTTRDASGNIVNGVVPTLTGIGSVTGSIPGANISAVTVVGVGIYDFNVINTVAEDINYTATAGGVVITQKGLVNFTLIAPDYTPTVTINGAGSTATNTVLNTADVNITVQISELIANAQNSGDVQFSIPFDTEMTYTFNTTDTGDWNLTTSATEVTFTYMANSGAFPANTTSTIELIGHLAKPAFTRGDFSVIVTILSGSGDTNANNNIDRKDVYYNGLISGAAQFLIDIASDNDGGAANNFTAAEYNNVAGVSGAVAANEVAYQAYIDGHTARFSSPMALTTEIQLMINRVLLDTIGADADDGATTSTNTTAAQFNLLANVTGALAANEVAYQAYINANPAAFSTPATEFEIQTMIDLVNTTTGAPVVTTLSPADDATSIDGDTNVSVTFNETVTAQAGKKLTIYTVEGGIVESINVTNGTLSGNTLTIDPTVPHLTYGRAHYINIDVDAVKDTDNVGFAGIANTTSWSFTVSGGACGCDDLDNCDLPVAAQLDAAGVTSLNIILAYGDNNTSTVPTTQDYLNAGVVNVSGTGALGATFPTVTLVTEINIATINAELASRPMSEVDTIVEIQAIVDALILNRNSKIRVSNLSGKTTEAGGTATFALKLNSKPSANVTIPLSSSDTSEGTVSPSSVTFTTTNWASEQTVTITGIDDALVDGNITYTIETAVATSSDSDYNGFDAADVNVVNEDNDSIISIPTITSTTPADNDINVTATNDLGVTFNQTIAAGTGDIVIYTAAGGALESIESNSTAISISGSTVTINPNAHLAYGVEHYVLIDGGVVTATVGNLGNVAVTDITTWSFTVENSNSTDECGCNQVDNCDLPSAAQ